MVFRISMEVIIADPILKETIVLVVHKDRLMCHSQGFQSDFILHPLMHTLLESTLAQEVEDCQGGGWAWNQ